MHVYPSYTYPCMCAARIPVCVPLLYRYIHVCGICAPHIHVHVCVPLVYIDQHLNCCVHTDLPCRAYTNIYERHTYMYSLGTRTCMCAACIHRSAPLLHCTHRPAARIHMYMSGTHTCKQVAFVHVYDRHTCMSTQTHVYEGHAPIYM